MTYVITQPCCNDASCITVCPVNCIHPTPDEPEFLTAEMLYIDPDTCIDCGSCVEECPVDAIFPDDDLTDGQARYLRMNADYFTDHDVEAGSNTPAGKQLLQSDSELHVAIVGAGPAAFYAAEELLQHKMIRVDMFDRLPTPYGLVRAGVAPDHPATKGVDKTFEMVAAHRSFEYFLNVEIGKHISADELTERYGAIIYAHGASADKRLGIEGEHLPGSIAATDFVAWYNGHPDYTDRTFDFASERAVVVGNGNVALDVARILLDDPERLARTDIADHALEQMRTSKITEVVLVGRRGVAQGAFTNAEFLAMGDVPGVDVVIDADELVLDDATAAARADGTLDSTIATKIRLAEEFAAREPKAGNKRVVFRFLVSPLEIQGTDAGVETVRFVRNEFVDAPGAKIAVRPTDEHFDMSAGIVMRAVGYTGLPLDGVPFDSARGVVPNTDGRVMDSPDGEMVPGLYVAGWIKRGATGGIGINRMDGKETARAVIADFVAGTLAQPSGSRTTVPEVIAERGASRVDRAGWKKIDTAEKTAGRPVKRKRVKIVTVAELEAAAGV